MHILTKKEKLLASAQKSLQEGHLAKALKDYQALVELDPKDLRNRQKLGELYNRARMTGPAIEEFQKVGKYYAENGFHLKAIAVYKQIQKIDPERAEVYGILAELNVKQGLLGNAQAEYRNLVAHFEKQGNVAKIVETLQKMKELDPENLNIRVKLSETYAKNGLRDEALADLREIMGILQAKQDPAKILKLCEIFSGLFPEELTLRAGLGVALVQKGEVEQGISILREVLEKSPDNWPVLRSLAEGYRKLGRHDLEQKIYTRLVSAFPQDLDLRALRVQALIDADELAPALLALDESRTAFLENDRRPALRLFYQALRDRLPNEERIGAALLAIDEVDGGAADFFDVLPVEGLSGDSRMAGIEVAAPEVETFELERTDAPGVVAGPGATATSAVADFEDDSEEIPLEFLEEVDEGEGAPAAETVELALDVDEVVFNDLDTDPANAVPIETADGPRAFNPDEEELSFTFDEHELSAEIPEGVAAIPDFDFDSVDDLVVGINALPASPGETSGGFFDFSADDLTEFSATPTNVAPAAGKKDRFALEGEFSRFKKGVEEQIDANDAESHFNLGIAYKEMGLLNDAIGEFDQVMRNAARRVDGLTLKGICLRDLNAYEQAEATFNVGLALPELEDNQRVSFLYELGLLYEAWNRLPEALENFRKVAAADRSFRNVDDRIQDLGRRMA